LLVANPRDTSTDIEHEMAHIVSLTLWGLNHPQDTWQREGLGVLASADQWPYSIDQLAAQSRRDGDSRSFSALAGQQFLEGDRMARFRAYMLSASFTSFLIREYGLPAFQHLWQRGDSAASSVYGADLPQLESRWHARLSHVTLPANGIDLNHVQQCQCR
jgi:hypothetical protein